MRTNSIMAQRANDTTANVVLTWLKTNRVSISYYASLASLLYSALAVEAENITGAIIAMVIAIVGVTFSWKGGTK